MVSIGGRLSVFGAWHILSTPPQNSSCFLHYLLSVPPLFVSLSLLNSVLSFTVALQQVSLAAKQLARQIRKPTVHTVCRRHTRTYIRIHSHTTHTYIFTDTNTPHTTHKQDTQSHAAETSTTHTRLHTLIHTSRTTHEAQHSSDTPHNTTQHRAPNTHRTHYSPRTPLHVVVFVDCVVEGARTLAQRKEPGFLFVFHCDHFVHVQHRRIPLQL